MDASAAVEAFAVNSELGRRVRSRLRGISRLEVPSQFPAEFVSATRGLLLGGHLTDDEASLGNRRLRGLRKRLHPFHRYEARVWELRANATVYDAWYIAVAEKLREPLVTTDVKFLSIPRVRCEIEVLESTA